jgi:N-acetylmuramic acid 6-phosphate etherase
VISGIKKCKENGISTGSISCNKNSVLSNICDFPVEVIVGPEYITGSSRMKAGTAQKMILNMISTTVMIKLGRVFNNKMVDMKLSNNKLQERAIRMLQSILKIDRDYAEQLIKENNNVRMSIEKFKKDEER